ncbi:tyrosine-type recombinase/integrase [Nocardioides zeicaulis]|uniref:Tyrosine-type recombinase/integrase n=1 Tax=Nocardioides zeicaulis TaxID=1776857 RepID=A0ABV6E1K9_9ACTN
MSIQEPADGTRSAVRDSQTTMLAGMLGASGFDVEQLIQAAALAGIVDSQSQTLIDLLPEVALNPAQGGERTPTVAEFYEQTVTKLAVAASGEEKRGGGLNRTYESYWKVMVEGWPFQKKGTLKKDGTRVGADPVPAIEKLYEGIGHMQLADVRVSHLKEVVDVCMRRAELNAERAKLRREATGLPVAQSKLDGAKRNAVGALRYFFNAAVDERIIDRDHNPAQSLKKPGKSDGGRRSFTQTEFADLWSTIVSGGDDPELDTLMWETVFVTGARREGLMNLDLRDLDHVRVSLWLDEKNGDVEEQPATADLLERLEDFARRRGATQGSDPVFAFKTTDRSGRPRRITDRRFDTVHRRIQKSLPWAARLGVTLHWARHHAITTVERVSGSEAVAARFARHKDTTVTANYDKATGAEVCAAVAAMTGTVHPLAIEGW